MPRWPPCLRPSVRRTGQRWPGWPPRGCSMPARAPGSALRDELARGLDAPLCLSSSGRRDPAELSTAEAMALVDELASMQVFYVNVGGGEPLLRPDFFELLEYAVSHQVGVKFSTNGTRLDRAKAARLAAMDYVDVQVSLDGATAEVNDA